MENEISDPPKKSKSGFFSLPPPPSEDFIRFKRGVGRFVFVLCICATAVVDASIVKSDPPHNALLAVILLPGIFCGFLAASIVAPFFLRGVTVPWSGTAFCSGVFVYLCFSICPNTWVAAIIADTFLCGGVSWMCYRRFKLRTPAVVQGDVGRASNIITE